MEKVIHSERPSELDIDGAIFRLISVDHIQEISRKEFMRLWDEDKGLRRFDSWLQGTRYYGLDPKTVQDIYLKKIYY